ncbi:outer membrane beta-barrel protein [Xanthomarina spongicola]|uniref:Outer membrane protein with beta-barrel domain n=1 Tax=Xanthomarina spongicola TaxID=570520 RepID=A0A316DJC8_9FLAO|nr:outer membrane beta-barrel protein [Xanthomarina spongicola]PWK18025.1 outer membrane protein with beta-barrel domain [Xanthomarina spongicola]
MKQVFYISLAFLVFTTFSQAQNKSGFGFKGGVNYNSNGDYFESISSNAEHPEKSIGYHFGIFGKLGNKIFVKPELVYTSTKSEYNGDSFKMQKLDAPVLVGLKFLKLLNVFVGPSFQYIIDTEFEGIDVSNIENDFTVGLNFGVGVSFNRIGIDLRYERGFSENEATFIDTNISSASVSRIDTRPDQLILSLSFIL